MCHLCHRFQKEIVSDQWTVAGQVPTTKEAAGEVIDCVNSSERLSQNLPSLLSEIKYSTWCELTNSGNIRQSSATITTSTTTTCPWIIGHFRRSVKQTTREVLGIAKNFDWAVCYFSKSGRPSLTLDRGRERTRFVFGLLWRVRNFQQTNYT